MKSINDIMQKYGLRLTACAYACAQVDDTDADKTEVKQPKRPASAKAKYPTVTIHGVVYDKATNRPLGGVQLQALGDKRYTAMTEDDGTFSIQVPKFVTSLYVHTPSYLSQ